MIRELAPKLLRNLTCLIRFNGLTDYNELYNKVKQGKEVFMLFGVKETLRIDCILTMKSLT